MDIPNPDAHVPVAAATAQLIVPVGTQIVTRVATTLGQEALALRPEGAVAEVVAAPADAEQAYRVRFAAGDEALLRRAEFAVRRQSPLARLGTTAGAALGTMAADDALEVYRPYIIYRCVVGSRAYGLAHEDSDVDRRGIYLPPADQQWSLTGAPEQVSDARSDEVYWELRKFLMLALKANPTALECLYTPLVDEMTPLTEELRNMRASFLSRQVYQSYGRYVSSQFRKLEADLRATGAIRWKHAMHLARLLLVGTVALREGYVPVAMEAQREQLLAIRHQRMDWAEVDAWRLELHRAFEAAYAATRLPERPDYARANAFLLRARRSCV
jgi:predicted nucleotidyltransferase